MDDRYGRPPRQSASRERNGGRAANASRPSQNDAGNGLLSRYHDSPPPRRGGQGLHGDNGLLARARRLGENLRATVMGPRMPRAGEWKASDFSPDELENWDHHDAAPFDLPPDPDAPAQARSYRNGQRESGPRRSNGDKGAYPRAGNGRRSLDDNMGWDDDEGDVGWESGTWDTRWATSMQPSLEYAGGRDGFADSGFWAPGRGADYDDQRSGPLATLAMIATPNAALSRRARLQILMRRRPAAAALVIVFLVGLFLSILAPLIPIIRLGYDVSDATYHAASLQSLFSGGASSLLSVSKLGEAKDHLNAIQQDLYEIDGVVGLTTAPLSSVSPTVRNYRLLIRIGYDLTAAGTTGIDVAQTLLGPLTGGALSSDGQGINADDIQRARVSLAGAEARVADALASYQQLDQSALPAQLKPDAKYGKLLALLTVAPDAFTEMKSLLDAAPGLLGIGAAANYIVLSLDRSELRPGGGFQGNYGVLSLEGGKQSADHPLSLHDVYPLDTKYFHNPEVNTAKDTNKYPDCVNDGPRPPDFYWWWPYQSLGSCQFNWGLRDSNLSPDFPTNARTAIQTFQYVKDEIPNNGPIAGVVAFTPVLIEDMLTITGNLTVPGTDGKNITVTPDSLEATIHSQQELAGQIQGAQRKDFTHQLSTQLLDRIKHLDKSKLKDLFNVVAQAIKHKDLQVYLTDPRAELLLQQLGLASEVNRGSGDSMFVNDANIGGNKANMYVTQHQTDVVTLLPNGGAIHHLQIATTFDKKGYIYNGTTDSVDYQAIERVYMPGDATILGYAGFTPRIFESCGPGNGKYNLVITDCSPEHAMLLPTTNSDVTGRTMVLGGLLVMCGKAINYVDFDSGVEKKECDSNNFKDAVKHTQNVYLTWYTPNAYTRDANGHGSYSLFVQKQAGTQVYLNGQSTSSTTLTVYVDTSKVNAQSGDLPTNDATLVTGDSTQLRSQRDNAFNKLTQQQGLQKPFDGPLTSDVSIAMGF
jgi:uncharacterized protein DUF4012